MIIKRELEKSLFKYLESEQSNVLLLSGARQVGKSTLVRESLKNRQSVTINLYESPILAAQIDRVENFDELEKLLRREVNFVPSQGTVLVIDEAQEAVHLGRWIRFFKEKWTRQKVIVLGSILSNLFEKGIPYPVGRVEELVLRPFSFKEYLTAIRREGLRETLENITLEKPLSESERQSFIKPYLEYLRCGGMPEVVMNPSGAAEKTLDRLIGQYAVDVERHLKEIYKAMFLSVLDRIADITCQPIKLSQMISTDSPSYRKLPLLLEVLEKWHLVHKVSAQTKHPESAGGLASKRYLLDAGFASLLMNRCRPVEWTKRSNHGNIVFPKLQENFVCTELVASTQASVLNYYKETRNSQEVDFVVPMGNRWLPIEVKSQSALSRNSLIPMMTFLRQRSLKCGVLVYNGEMRRMRIEDKTVYAVPAFLAGELPVLVMDSL